MNHEQVIKVLTNKLAKMQIIASEQQIQQLTDFIFLLVKWSKAFNLTSIKDVASIIPLHILDSLCLHKYIQGEKQILDVGTGAGLPGIPLAILNPQINFTLVDSQQKKINFVQHVLTSLKLQNVVAQQCRVEKLQVSYRFDMVVARAFASIDEFVKLIEDVCDKNTKIIAMKAKQTTVEHELGQLPTGFELLGVEQVTIPDVAAQRCLVMLRKT